MPIPRFLRIAFGMEPPSHDSETAPEELTRASRVLAHADVRLMQIDGQLVIGIWSDLDSIEIRYALELFGSGDAPVRYLDGPGIPDRFRLRRVAGEPVPLDVLHEMERSPEPWKVRDRMLKESLGAGSAATGSLRRA